MLPEVIHVKKTSWEDFKTMPYCLRHESKNDLTDLDSTVGIKKLFKSL